MNYMINRINTNETDNKNVIFLYRLSNNKITIFDTNYRNLKNNLLIEYYKFNNNVFIYDKEIIDFEIKNISVLEAGKNINNEALRNAIKLYNDAFDTNLEYNKIFDIDSYVDKITKIYNANKFLKDFKESNKKIINDMITSISINKLLVSKINLLDEYMHHIIINFGFLDNDHLNICDIKMTDNDNEYIIATNNINLDNRNLHNKNFKGYFVFKGGSLIKYWAVKKYLTVKNKIGHLDYRSIHSIINEKIDTIIEDDKKYVDILLSFSDYDFSYYLNGSENEFNDVYINLLKHIYYRVSILRSELNELFKKNYINNYVKCTINGNIKLSYLVQEYLKDKTNPTLKKVSSPIDNINNKIIHNCYNRKSTTDLIITTSNNDKTLMYGFKQDYNINISFNNSVLIKDANFDLFRLKYNVSINNNEYYDNFASELFDLSIVRNNKINNIMRDDRNVFCDNINIFTSVLINTYNDIKNIKKNYVIRTFSLLYTLKDLLRQLFSIEILFPWNNKKYEKKITRLAFLTCAYSDDLFFINQSNIINFYYILYILYFNHHYDIDAKYDINSIYKLLNGAIDTMKILMKQHKIENVIIDEFVAVINNIRYNFIDNQNNIDNEMLNGIFELDHKKNDYVSRYLISILFVYLRKIILNIDNDGNGWCSRHYKGKCDLYQLKNDFNVYLKTLADNLLIGLETQTLFIDFINEAKNNNDPSFNRSSMNKMNYVNKILKKDYDGGNGTDLDLLPNNQSINNKYIEPKSIEEIKIYNNNKKFGNKFINSLNNKSNKLINLSNKKSDNKFINLFNEYIDYVSYNMDFKYDENKICKIFDIKNNKFIDKRLFIKDINSTIVNDQYGNEILTEEYATIVNELNNYHKLIINKNNVIDNDECI